LLYLFLAIFVKSCYLIFFISFYVFSRMFTIFLTFKPPYKTIIERLFPGTINNFGVSSVYCGNGTSFLLPQYTEETPKLFIVPDYFTETRTEHKYEPPQIRRDKRPKISHRIMWGEERFITLNVSKFLLIFLKFRSICYHLSI
jgi:hypothetical protein